MEASVSERHAKPAFRKSRTIPGGVILGYSSPVDSKAVTLVNLQGRVAGSSLAVWTPAGTLRCSPVVDTRRRLRLPFATPTLDPGVSDFGLARLMESPSPTKKKLCEAHGTPRYAAPEQLRGESLDARSDQYAFCVALWEALSGSSLPSSLEEPAGGGDGSTGSRASCKKGLAADSSDRFPDMAGLLAALRKQTSRRQVRLLIGTGAVAASVLLFLGP